MDYDLRINGNGLALLLVASAILQARPDLSLLLVSTDLEPGGDSLEPVLPDRLAASFRRLLESAIVRTWPGYCVRTYDGVRDFSERVWLIDPVQAWLELAEQPAPPAFQTLASRRSEPDLAPEEIARDRVTAPEIHLPAGAVTVTASKIVGAQFLSGLTAPVLADFSLGHDSNAFLQYIPLGDETVAMRTIACDGGMAAATDVAQLITDRWSEIAATIESLAND